MAFEENKFKKSDYDNDWAKDVKGEPIHIDNAKSGLQGYYCLGCDKEMQGVKFKNPNHQSFFRHHAHNVDKDKIECVVASKNFRERIASSILNRLKYVKVPTLYKYPPKGTEGFPIFLQKSKIISAAKVMSELSFYEDEEGNIKWGKNPNIEDRYLLVRPDVTFFDSVDNPILFIEFVITHKITDDKKVKLSRLGIDTVQIIIPKVPEAEIEKAIKSVRKYKWIYNELEANTKYIPVSKGNTEGLPPIDEEQRKLFEESYSCRAAKINNLVRDINKCLRSESYRRVERLFESELSRVTKNRQRNQQGLEELEESNREEALTRNRKSHQKVKDKYEDLEKRYNNKNQDLQQATEAYDSDQRIRESIEYYIEQEKATIERIEQETNEFDKRIEFEESKMGERVWDEFSRETELVEKRIEEIRSEDKGIEDKIRTSINSKIKATERSIGDIRIQQEQIESTIWEEFRTNIEFEKSEIQRIEREEKGIKKTVRDELHRKLNDSPSELSRRVKNILEAERMGNDFKNDKRKEASYKRTRKFFNKGTWQKG
ncbi:MAG: hypothetical protein QM499_07445 [Flavobacteriaceae bacterium]